MAEQLTDLTFTPATELRALIRSRRVSPVEVLESVLARAEAVHGQLSRSASSHIDRRE